MTAPHAVVTPAHTGAPLADAAGAVVLAHGRGASAESILGLAAEIGRPDLAWLAPHATDGAWYPYSFLAPVADNEPGLSSGIGLVMAAVALAEAAGIPRERIVLGGFSQGACLALETAARHAGRWGGVVGLSGGLIGTGPSPAGASPLGGMGGRYPDKAFDYAGRLDGTPVFLGGSDTDPHIPLARLERTAEVFRQLGGAVDLRVYPGAPHAVHADEVAAFRALLADEIGAG